MKPTIRDIARETGLGKSTVSMALRGVSNISAETRERVRAAAEKLGYRPDPRVSELMTYLSAKRERKITESLALFTFHTYPKPWTQNPYYARFYEAVCARADELGYRIEEFWRRDPRMTSRRLASVLDARGIRGIILGPDGTPGGRVIFDWSRFAVARRGRRIWLPRVSFSEAAVYSNTLLAIKQLRRLGYSRIGIVLPGGTAKSTHEHEGAYWFSVHNNAKLRIIPPYVEDSWDQRDFWPWFEAHRPDAIFSSFPGVASWLTDRGYRIPEDIGFALASLPPGDADQFAGIDILPELGDRAVVDLVVEQLNAGQFGEPKYPKIVRYEGVWREGPTVRQKTATK